MEKKKEKYFDNVKFSHYVEDYKKQIDDPAIRHPKMHDYIGICLETLIRGLLTRYNWKGYTDDWKELMYTYAIVDCVRSVPNFDPSFTNDKGEPNAYSYFNWIASNAFTRATNRSKKHKEGLDEYILTRIDEYYHSDSKIHNSDVYNYTEELKNKKILN